MMICFDWIFPEAARTLALKGAQIIAHPANLVLPYCQNAMVTRSIENQVFTVTANRVGKETSGKSPPDIYRSIAGHHPWRQNSLSWTNGKECVHLVEIDPEHALNKRLNANNDLFEDRRPSLYEMD